MNPLESAAQRYAEIGWPVIPCHTPTGDSDKPCSCHKADCGNIGKHPRTMNGVSDATTDRDKIAERWDMWEDANIGVAMGEDAGCFAIDVDPRHGGDKTLAELERKHGKLPETRTQDTGSDGAHLVFKYPNFKLQNLNHGELGPGLDVKSDGRYIVAAPSLHFSGKRYRWRNAAPAVAAPAWFLKLLQEAMYKKNVSASSEVGENILDGQRDVTLTSLAGSMRRRGMDAAEIEAALIAVNDRRCKPPLSASQVRKIANSVSRYEPAQEQGAEWQPATTTGVDDTLRHCGR
jgi:putative DNA primase/helicase